jgi:hypothetical protein
LEEPAEPCERHRADAFPLVCGVERAKGVGAVEDAQHRAVGVVDECQIGIAVGCLAQAKMPLDQRIGTAREKPTHACAADAHHRGLHAGSGVRDMSEHVGEQPAVRAHTQRQIRLDPPPDHPKCLS